MGLFKSMLDKAHECTIKGKILAECGDMTACLIATQSLLYVGKMSTGKAPINLQSFPWPEVAQVHSKEGIFDVEVTAVVAKAVQDRVSNAAVGAVVFGVLGALAAAVTPKNEITVTLKKSQRDHATNFVTTARQLMLAQSQSADQSAAASPSSLATELEKLQSLRERGVLTDDEFAAAKKRVIDQSSDV